MSDADDALLEILRRIYTAVQRGDTDELKRSVAHDIEWVLPETVPWGGTHHGPEGVEAVYEIYREHADGIWPDPDDLLVADDRAVVLGRLSARARATGRRFEVPFVHVWTLSDGVPARFRAYFDSAPITAALEGQD